jgi:hypothetical protein
MIIWIIQKITLMNYPSELLLLKLDMNNLRWNVIVKWWLNSLWKPHTKLDGWIKSQFCNSVKIEPSISSMINQALNQWITPLKDIKFYHFSNFTCLNFTSTCIVHDLCKYEGYVIDR